MNTLFKALSHPVRRRIIEMLRQGPMASGDIAAAYAFLASDDAAMCSANNYMVEAGSI